MICSRASDNADCFNRAIRVEHDKRGRFYWRLVVRSNERAELERVASNSHRVGYRSGLRAHERPPDESVNGPTARFCLEGRAQTSVDVKGAIAQNDLLRVKHGIRTDFDRVNLMMKIPMDRCAGHVRRP